MFFGAVAYDKRRTPLVSPKVVNSTWWAAKALTAAPNLPEGDGLGGVEIGLRGAFLRGLPRVFPFEKASALESAAEKVELKRSRSSCRSSAPSGVAFNRRRDAEDPGRIAASATAPADLSGRPTSEWIIRTKRHHRAS